MLRQDVLDKAGAYIAGDRDVQYGHPYDNFGRIAAMWEAYLDRAISRTDVAAMMALVKVARLANDTSQEDTWIDLAGYAALGGELIP